MSAATLHLRDTSIFEYGLDVAKLHISGIFECHDRENHATSVTQVTWQCTSTVLQRDVVVVSL